MAATLENALNYLMQVVAGLQQTLARVHQSIEREAMLSEARFRKLQEALELLQGGMDADQARRTNHLIRVQTLRSFSGQQGALHRRSVSDPQTKPQEEKVAPEIFEQNRNYNNKVKEDNAFAITRNADARLKPLRNITTGTFISPFPKDLDALHELDETNVRSILAQLGYDTAGADIAVCRHRLRDDIL